MQQLVKISSKRQITIPAAIYKSLGLQQNEGLLIKLENKTITILKAQQAVEKLAGRIPVPHKYKGKDIEYIIKDAKQNYFKNKR